MTHKRTIATQMLQKPLDMDTEHDNSGNFGEGEHFESTLNMRR